MNAANRRRARGATPIKWLPTAMAIAMAMLEQVRANRIGRV